MTIWMMIISQIIWKNTGFKVSNDGLIAKYNKAPNIEGVRKNRTISKGVIDLLEDINVSDEIDAKYF